MRPKVAYTLFIFWVTASLNHAIRAVNTPPHTSSSCSAYISVPKTAQLYSAKWRKNASGGHKLQLTIQWVVAGRGLLAVAAAHGEALWLGYRAGSAGETLFAGKVAL